LRKILLYLFCLSFYFSGISQLKMDSVFKSLDTVSKFLRKLDKLESLSIKKRLSSKELSEILAWINAASERTSNQREKMFAAQSRGDIYNNQNKDNDALLEFFKLLRLAEDQKDMFMASQANKNIAEVYQKLGNRKFASNIFILHFNSLKKQIALTILRMCTI